MWGRLAVLRSLTVLLCLAAVSVVAGGACGRREPGVGTGESAGRAASVGAAAGSGIFADRTASSELDFVHVNGMSGELYFCEMMGAGGALLDYDGDGDLDAYLAQGHGLGAADPADPRQRPTDRLYRNDLVVDAAGRHRARFVDVTAESRIDGRGYGMAVAAGDVDGDGWVDLYVANFGRNQLLRNNGDGTFRDVTAAAGVDDPRWSTSASFLDYDADGRLDLFVVAYVDFTLENHRQCFAPTSAPDYCTPLAYDPEPDRLFRNRGDGTFADVTAAAGILNGAGAGLGVVAADLDGDGRTDLYVANDQMANHLWINRGDGRFAEEALLAGCALDRDGRPEASMGVDAADFDDDGDLDLFVTHLAGEKNTLYVNRGSGWFEDRSHEAGLALPSLPFTAFGTAWIDYDNDSALDLLTVNGDVRLIEVQLRAGDPHPLRQHNQLFHNLGGGTFEETTDRAGPAFDAAEVSRGAAFGDLDNDGDVDVLVLNNNGPARLLINELGQARPWLGAVLVEGPSPPVRETRLSVLRPDRPPLRRRPRRDGSYASASDPRLVVGLGGGPQDPPPSPALRVEWPGGRVQEWRGAAPGAYAILYEEPSGGRGS